MMDYAKLLELMPDFTIKSFILFDEILSLHWEEIIDKNGEAHKQLSLVMKSFNGYTAWFEFMDVNAFHFQGNGQICDFTVEDMLERGYERSLAYKISDLENDAIGFYCSNIIVQRVQSTKTLHFDLEYEKSR